MAGKNSVEIILAAKDQASKTLKDAFGTMEDAHSRFLGTVKAGAVLATTALGAIGGYIAKTGIDYDQMAEQSQVAWTTLLGSQEKAKQQMQDIANFAKSTPFETEQVDQMAKYMNNAGLSGKALFDQLMRVSDVASAFNIPADSAAELTRQMSQVMQAGTAYTEDLNILGDRGVPILQALAKEMGTNVGNVKQLASQGKITSQEYMQAFNDISNGVKGASDKQSKTYGGMLSTLSDNLKIISGTLMQGAFNYLKETLDKVMPLLDRFSSTLKDKGLKTAIGEIVGKEETDKLFTMFTTIKEQGVKAFDLLKSSVKFVIDNFNTLEPIMAGAIAIIAGFKIVDTITKIYETWITVTKMMAVAQEGLNIVLDLNPIGLVVLAVGALVAAGIALYKNWDTVKTTMSTIMQAIESTAATMVNNIIDNLDWLIEKINFVTKLVGVTIPKISHVDWGTQSGSGGGGSVGDLPAVAHYASGTDFHAGGFAIVGENGPELVDLPRGSGVRTASQTKQLLQSKGHTYNYNLSVVNNQNMSENDLMKMFQRMEILHGF